MALSPRVLRLLASLDRLRSREDQLALLLSLVIGALVGLVVVAFILVTELLAAWFFPPGGAAWRRLAIPTAGALITGWLLVRFFPTARGSGIPQTKAAIVIHDGWIAFRTVIGKFVCCSLSLASGIALGREGPSVHIGAGLASVIARRFRLSTDQVRWLIPVGTSAALAAAFNTPIAAVLFSLEEIMGDLHAPILGSVVLSAAASWMILHLLLGDEPLFQVAGYQLVSPSEFGFYALLGVIGGLASVLFVRLLLSLRRGFLRLPHSTLWLQPAAGGLCVGVAGLFVPAVLGVGYDQVERVLAGDVFLRSVLLLAGLKIVATAVCYASGNAGGIFGPSLFIGAMIGAALGSVVHQLFPDTTAGPGAYALVGMGAAFAGIIRTPLTSVIMIFEVTRDYTIIVPLMIANLVSFFISQRLQPTPIYEALARQDGVHLPTGESQRPTTRVLAAMRQPAEVLAPELSVRQALEHVASSRMEAWPVVGPTGFHGMVSRTELETRLADARGEEPLRAFFSLAVTGSRRRYLHPDHTLSVALSSMGETGATVLPVVSRADVRQLLGTVTLRDVLSSFGLPDGGPRDGSG